MTRTANAIPAATWAPRHVDWYAATFMLILAGLCAYSGWLYSTNLLHPTPRPERPAVDVGGR